ncbi:MAG: hypothetical protein HN348_23510, partial [Proteobacteria bacterium]|nr:hypothetical protein [Pseudomonadota bacterium]
VSWDDLTDIPADLADGDNDTTYTAGTGLDLTGTEFVLDETHAEFVAQNVCFDLEDELTDVLDDNYLSAGYTPDWDDISNLPAGLDDGDDDTTYLGGIGLDLAGTEFSVNQATIEGWAEGVCFNAEDELTSLLDDNYLAASYVPGWGELSNIPNGLDNGDDDTTYSAGTALNLAGTEFSVVQATIEGWAEGVCFNAEDELTSLLDDNYLAASYVPGWGELSNIPNGLDNGDDDTTYSAGTALNLAGTEFSVVQATIEGWAEGVCYDTEGELTGLLDDNYVGKDGSGNVGIGTVPTTARLTVHGPAENDVSSPTITMSGDGTGSVLKMGLGYSSDDNAWIDGSGSLSLNPNGGYVGIGATQPQVLLTLGGASPRIAADTVDESDSSYVGVGGGGDLGHTRGGEVINYGNEFVDSPGYRGRVTIGAGDVYTEGLDGAIVMRTGASAERMVIERGGDVGIGTSDPGSKLEVAGEVKATNHYIAKTSYVLAQSAGDTWLRIAQGQSNTYGEFRVTWQTSSQHGSLLFTASCNYPSSFQQCTINSHHWTEHGYPGVKAIRFVRKSTYDQYYLEILAGNNPTATNSLAIEVKDNRGFQILDAAPGSIPASYVEEVTDVTNTKAVFGNGALTVSNLGRVGIWDSTPNYNLEVAGSTANDSGSWIVRSDERLKKEIEPIDGAVKTVEALQGVTFRWRDAEKDDRYGRVRGFVAQEVEKVVPEWVSTDDDGFKRLETIGIDALVIEAIKEQQQTINELQKENDVLQQRLDALDERLATVAGQPRARAGIGDGWAAAAASLMLGLILLLGAHRSSRRWRA